MQWDADELLVLARLDLQKENVEGALHKLKQAKQLTATASVIDVELGRLYAQIGLRKRAIPYFETYVQSFSADTDARFQLGMAHYEEGDHESATATWLAVSAVDPTYPPLLYFQALLLSQRGETSQAKEQLRRALEVLPADNLYFSRARDLLSSLEAPGSDEKGTVPASSARRQH